MYAKINILSGGFIKAICLSKGARTTCADLTAYHNSIKENVIFASSNFMVDRRKSSIDNSGND